MNIDLHSHFFPVEALSNPGKYQDRAPKIVLDKGKLSVTSQIGMRAGLGEGAYDAVARIKALDKMSIDLQAISPSPILLFYSEEPVVAAHFSRKQNEAIQEIVKKHPDRFVGFGSVPLQSIPEAIATGATGRARRTDPVRLSTSHRRYGGTAQELTIRTRRARDGLLRLPEE